MDSLRFRPSCIAADCHCTDQVYRLDPGYGAQALAGTAEMGLGGLLCNTSMAELPARLCAVSRCYRAETGRAGEEKGLYRVHSFTKASLATSILRADVRTDRCC